jgi:hypothetical protein
VEDTVPRVRVARTRGRERIFTAVRPATARRLRELAELNGDSLSSCCNTILAKAVGEEP